MPRRRRLILAVSAFWLLAPLEAAIWPDQFGAFQKTATETVQRSGALWEEYGLEAAEQAKYSQNSKQFTATAYRLKDATSAYAAFEWLRPSDATPSSLGKLAVKTPESTLLAFGNYVFDFQGRPPEAAELEELFQHLPRLDQSSLPISHLPTLNLSPNSERYILGPASLEQFERRIPPSVAAFRLGVEAQLGTFHTKAGDMRLTVFAYPTPQIARERLTAFEALPGSVSKRSGPLVAVTIAPPDPDAAERVLAQVNYQASITWNEPRPGLGLRNAGVSIVHMIYFAGLLILFSAVAGLAYGGVRILRRRFGGPSADESMIVLHLADK